MIEAVITGAAFFGGMLSFLIAMGQVIVTYRRLENVNLAFLFTCVGIVLMQYGFILNNTDSQMPGLLSFHLTFLYLLGPLLYYAYYLVVRFEDTLPISKLLYLMPAVAALVLDLWFLKQPAFYRLMIIDEMFRNDVTGTVMIIRILVLGAAFQAALYLGLLLRNILIFWRFRDYTFITTITLIYIVISTVSLLLIAAAFMLGSLVVLQVSVVFITLLLMGTYLVGQRHPEFLQILIKEARKKRYEKSLLKGYATDELCSRLQHLMDTEKVYAYEDITLKQLADELELTPHQLSQLLNEKLNMNFNTFVNQFRIRDAKHMLIEEPQRSVLSIAYAVGFNSKSSFYDAFSRFTGKTPQKYRKDNLAGS